MVADFPLEYRFGFHIEGLIAQAFFQPYALTLDFMRMRLLLAEPERR